MIAERTRRLQNNVRLMFWINVCIYVRFFNAIASIFFLARGLDYSQVLSLAIWWGVGSALFEIPSSYLADKWGRKKTLILGLALGLAYWGLLLVGTGYLAMGIASFLYGVMSAFISGTDVALVYDSKRELEEKNETLSSLGKAQSGRNFGKIIAVTVGAIVARDLTDAQFSIVLLLDIALLTVGLFLASRLCEPHHKVDIDLMKKGVLRDAFVLVRSNKRLQRAIIHQELMFIGSLIIWYYFQAFFLELAVPVVLIGVIWGLRNIVAVPMKWYISYLWPHISLEQRIQRVGVILLLSLISMCAGWFFEWSGILLLFIFSFVYFNVFGLDLVFFSEIFNRETPSFHRSTTLSFIGFIHSAAQIPLFLIASWLISYSLIAPYIMVAAMALIALLFFRLTPTHTYEHTP